MPLRPANPMLSWLDAGAGDACVADAPSVDGLPVLRECKRCKRITNHPNPLESYVPCKYLKWWRLKGLSVSNFFAVVNNLRQLTRCVRAPVGRRNAPRELFVLLARQCWHFVVSDEFEALLWGYGWRRGCKARRRVEKL